MQREILRFQSVQFKYTALGHKIIFVAVSECMIIVLFTINDPIFIYRGAAGLQKQEQILCFSDR